MVCRFSVELPFLLPWFLIFKYFFFQEIGKVTRMYIVFLCKDHLFLKPRKTYSKIDVALCETHTHVYAQMLHKMSDKVFHPRDVI